MARRMEERMNNYDERMTGGKENRKRKGKRHWQKDGFLHSGAILLSS